jgi:YtkA-like
MAFVLCPWQTSDMLAGRGSTLVLFASLALFGCDSCDESDAEHGSDAPADTHGETHGDSDDTGDTGGEGVCAVETRDDDFAVGLSKSGSLTRATFVSANPAPLIKGDNTWVLDFTDLDGAPLVGLTVVVVPMMPDHGHGTPINAVVTELEQPGRYEVTPVNLFMTGYWESTFDITLAGGEQDSLMFGFCVE